MDFKIKQENYNPLPKRKEVSVEVEHEGRGTPSRIDLRKAVASKFSTKTENVYVIDVETKTGTQNAVCLVEVYDDPQAALHTVPKYIQVRNLPPDERKQVREQQAKKEETKPKAAEGKPEAKAKPEAESKEGKTKPEAKPTEAPKKSKEPEAK